MASIVLSAAGSSLGGMLAGGIGASLGSMVGRTLGGFIDQNLFGEEKIKMKGPRLSDLTVQTSTYGRMIPVLYGKARMSGNMIWSRPIREVVTTSSSGGGGGKGGGGGGASVTTVTYSYYASFAVAICEGAVDAVLRIWADAKLLNLSKGTYRIYKGTESQNPDAMIESYQTAGRTPAYRGLAYVVFEDFPLADYGNRIPNFTFEVRKTIAPTDADGVAVESLIGGINLIPGSGEYVYDTETQYKMDVVSSGAATATTGIRTALNAHTHEGKANALVALDQLEQTLPNLSWVSVVVGWFGNSLDAGACVIKPGVEFSTEATTTPDIWQVGSFSRTTAHLITRDSNNSPIYGGTPDDSSLIRLLTELKNRGYNILLVPMFFMDTTGKPWRGRVTGSAADVAAFFTKTNGYNAFVSHYANLTKDYVDAFAIGSELKGLTKVMGASGVFPAVDALVSLAATVKGVVGSGVKVTYAADWSEYHHTDGGWYNLDPLWASPNIDFVGIDAYFPLTDEMQSGYDIQKIKDGWTSGEGYDWYYTDAERTTKASLSPAWAWKNIAWWWNNSHTNPDSTTTGWTAQMKKIWFVEYGFPSIDGATNEPNVFYDPTSSESAFPRFSRGRVDWRIQRAAIAATESKWAGSSMVERKFIWAWDARPFPYWPDLMNVWGDGGAWKYGHWISGKMGVSGLGGIVLDLCKRAGLSENEVDVSRLNNLVEGMVLTQPIKARDAIELLQQAYFFDAVESDGLLKFMPRGQQPVIDIAEADMVPDPRKTSEDPLRIKRSQEMELPQSVRVSFFNPATNYQPGLQYGMRESVASSNSININLPVVMNEQQAKIIADTALYNAWAGRHVMSFHLPVKFLSLEPSDVVSLTSNGVTHNLRVTRCWYGKPGLMEVEAVSEDVAAYDFYAPPGLPPVLTDAVPQENATISALLDLPLLPAAEPYTPIMHLAACGQDAAWQAAVWYRSDDGGVNYTPLLTDEAASVMGTALTVLAVGETTLVDEINSVEVAISGDGELASAASELAFLNGANVAALGDEIIQFRNAIMLEPGKYRLSGLLRGRLGTDYALASHAVGEVFILLDGSINQLRLSANMIGVERHYKTVSVAENISAAPAAAFTYNARALKPLSPVHVSGHRDVSGNLAIGWVRRVRGGAEWLSGADAPLNESAEKYEVDILNGATLVRTINCTTPSILYTAAEQIADFGSPQVSVNVAIYQISELVGRGYGGVIVV